MTTDRVAIIDVGSSALKYGIYRLEGERVRLWREADSVATGLGRGLSPGAPLPAPARRATLEQLRIFAGELADLDCRIAMVIATEAVRQAGDQADFLAEVSTIFPPPTEVRCISADQEARWAFESARESFGPFDEPVLVVDPGGSSHDFAHGLGPEPAGFISLPFGMNRLMEIAPPEPAAGRVSEAGITALREELSARYRQLRRDLDAVGRPRRLIATSGAVIALAGVQLTLTASDRDTRSRKTHACRLRRADIRRMIADLAPLTAAERRSRHPCLGETRSLIFIHGALIYDELLESLGLDDLTVNGFGMKMGAIADWLRRSDSAPSQP